VVARAGLNWTKLAGLSVLSVLNKGEWRSVGMEGKAGNSKTKGKKKGVTPTQGGWSRVEASEGKKKRRGEENKIK